LSSKPLNFDSDAIEEAREAYQWYLDRSPAAAGRFLLELESALAAIQADPSRFGPYVHMCRRRPLRRYPYIVVFREAPHEILVVAVAHERRRAGYWKDRLR
jgi:plasmid stabilization system protein ParE